MPTHDNPDIACIVLAAGLSRRFGSPKMRHALADDKTLIETTLSRYLTVFATVHVVIAADDAELAGMLQPLAVELVRVANNAGGMSYSLVAGIKAALAADGYLIALGDMPYVQPATVAKLAATLKRNNIVVPTCQGRVGNPVGFGSEFREALLALSGDRGARSVVQQASDRVLSVETGDEGVLLDIDYPSAILPTHPG